MERNILYLPCGHYIHEIVLERVFDTMLFTISGPDVPMFKRYPLNWANKNIFKYWNVWTGHCKWAYKKKNASDVRSDVFIFAVNYSKNHTPKEKSRRVVRIDGYFFRRVTLKIILFIVPGGIYLTRWMANVLYLFKYFYSEVKFVYNRMRKILSIASICVFIIRLYIKSWFIVTLAPNTLN